MATDPDDTDLRHSTTDGRSSFEPDGTDESGVPPPRFGRLALCLAAAGALTFGVMGTVAYGVWFNQDQQTYADAIAGARQALGSSAPAVPTVAVAHAPQEAAAPAIAQSATQPTASDVALATAGSNGGFEDTNPAVWSGQVHPSTPESNLTAALADTPVDTSGDLSAGLSDHPPTAPIVPTPPPRSMRHVANSTAKPAGGQHAKETRVAQQERRASSQHNGGLFARIGQFFRRVSYRQHDNGRQQPDPYSHP